MTTSQIDTRRSWPPLDPDCVLSGSDARLRLAALSTIAAILVQEVSQPITAATNYVHGCARQLRAGRAGADAAALLPMVERAGAELVKAGEIVRRMHNFIANGRVAGRAESLAAMIGSIGAEPACPDGVRPDVRIAIEPGADLVSVDRILIEHVVSILFANACDAMDGLDHRRIEIGASRVGINVVLRIEDSGPGLTHYQFIHMFEPLFTAKSGTGLSMAICKTIIEVQGGRLWAEPPGSGGAAFRLSLPAADCEP